MIIGGFWPETYKDYLSIELCGNFLSIIESSDPHGTCEKIFADRKYLESKNEVVLNTVPNHGFIYKEYREWLDPLLDGYLNTIK